MIFVKTPTGRVKLTQCLVNDDGYRASDAQVRERMQAIIQGYYNTPLSLDGDAIILDDKDKDLFADLFECEEELARCCGSWDKMEYFLQSLDWGVYTSDLQETISNLDDAGMEWDARGEEV